MLAVAATWSNEQGQRMKAKKHEGTTDQGQKREQKQTQKVGKADQHNRLRTTREDSADGSEKRHAAVCGRVHDAVVDPTRVEGDQLYGLRGGATRPR
jgi:hypothetical protein